MKSLLDQAISATQQAIYEHVVQPVLYATGGMGLSEMAFDGTEWFVIGLFQLAVLVPAMSCLERAFPVEAVTDRRAVRTDVFYALMHRLGIFPVIAFLLLTPVFDVLEGWLRLAGFSRPNLDALWAGVTDRPLVSFALYVVALDFVDYWIHRGQHAWQWWWELHAVHHSQRQMTFWSDERNHVLDDLLRDAILASVALLAGVPPGQFLWLVLASQVVQQLQHANLRLRLPVPLRWMVVGPEFHRRHHGIGVGHEGPVQGVNFGVLLPWWDMLFGTADWRDGFVPTGIRDQLDGRDYGRGFLSQQWLALRRIAAEGQGGR